MSAAPGQSKPLVGINYNKSFRLATNDFLKKNLRDTLAFVSLMSLGHYNSKPLVGINYSKSFRLATNDFLKKNLLDTLAFVSLVSLGHYRGQVYVLN